MESECKRNLGRIWDSKLFDFIILFPDSDNDKLGKIVTRDLELYIRVDGTSGFEKTNIVILKLFMCGKY